MRTVELLPPLADDLARWREAAGNPSPEALIFPRSDGEVWRDEDYRNWRKHVFHATCDALGIARCRVYDLRHLFASLLIHEGSSPVKVARQMGNQPSMTLDTYSHVFDELGDERIGAAETIYAARDEWAVRAEYAEAGSEGAQEDEEAAEAAPLSEALFRTRTGDPLLTIAALSSSALCGP